MDKANSPVYLKYLATEGEMSELILAFDWSATSLGSVENWSNSLLTTVGIILRAKVPMLVWWGVDLIQIYNDAYRAILGEQGKHPYALGTAAKECWIEIWPVIGPLIAQVRETGQATWQEDSLIPILRNGKIEDIYWSFSYSEVIDDGVNFGGILVTCFETTARVNVQRTKNITLKELAAYKIRMNNLITQAPVAIGLLMGREFVINTANRKILQLWGKLSDVIGLPLAAALPELEGQGFLEILDEVYLTGKAYSSTAHLVKLVHKGSLEDFYFDFTYQKLKGKNNEHDMILVMANDVTTEVNARKNVEQSALQFRQLADSITQMVWITDATGMHEYYNKRWYDFTGTDFESSKGEAWATMFHPDDREKAWEKWNHSLKTGEPYEIEYRLKNAAGHYIWVLGRAAPFYNAAHQIIKWFGTCTDINEQKLMLQMQDDFISIASHELKTPVTVLRAYLQLMMRAKDPLVITDLLTKVNVSANKIFDLVDELLDVGKLSHGKLALSKTVFNLSAMISECCEHLTLDNKYMLEVVGDLDLEVHADLRRIQQVVTNFVNNAVKYAPESKQISVEIQHSDRIAKVAVRDYGHGICQDKLPYLFDRYYRVADQDSRQGGLGLGLFICSEIIKEHGGDIGVESKLNEGSTFWFSLPLS